MDGPEDYGYEREGAGYGKSGWARRPSAQLATRSGGSRRNSSKISPRSLFSLTPNMIAWHGIFQMLDRVSFCSRRPLFTNETRPMKLAMRRARRSEENLSRTFL
ncbi:hypothetical protein T01_13494 [Trichinella spiralis]|uniref:Uncharacterized protein n=1 Tax=Trichinella spiralis TaxID=6334 RepID=A0A0V1ALT7_TRISP|nr:hypothetical protein T01_13494 [Trichinella spiralis]